MQVLEGRQVPLGGIRALTVRRTLPHRDRSFVGAWCFVDHYGPAPVGADGSGGMDVPPHPHTGLQTVSWLFEGEIEHRDSGGNHAMVRPGEVNLMTGGSGIAHSEVSTPATDVLHGVQLWVALPDALRQHARAFEHFVPDRTPLAGGAGTAYVFLGVLDGVGTSPVETHSPLLGAQLDLVPDATLELTLDPAYEHGVLLDIGALSVAGRGLAFGELACLDAGADALTLTAGPVGARVILLGGPPFEEEIVMWWNFVARTHDEIVQARAEWEASNERFGGVPGYAGPVARIPAPPLPGGRLRARNRKGRV